MGRDRPGSFDGSRPSPTKRLANVLELARTAESVGLHIVGIGEGHGPHRINQHPFLLLAALCQVTERIRLSTTASVLTTADPVRTAEQLSLLSLLSNGRADLVAGRGALPRDLDLFAVESHLQEEIFEERLDQLLDLLRPGPSELLGEFRDHAHNVELPATGRDPQDLVWAASSGSPRSVLRAAGHGLGVMLNVMEGEWRNLVPYVKAYREALRGFGDHTSARGGLALPALVAPDNITTDPWQAAVELAHPYFSAGARTYGAASPEDPTWSLEEFAAQCAPAGSLLVGGVSDVVEKLSMLHRELDLERILLRVDINGLPHDTAIRTVRLLGDQVLPQLREKHMHGRDSPGRHG
ncbi:LLM class flavin-dependent oxidoreductase [Kocuria sp. cx-455]|uniref:LLM class flavin-dependent oxidoreductase n=1 Tax=Kocuria sp. cx-455 TaxID=2771377 RepID=UPI002803EFAB|nr:LLM class flavin-dependent oxidoreductase [Kocuria sp. cx-455]